MARFSEKVALVTGGSRGIGRAIVEQLAKEGAKVAFVYRSNEDAANETAAAVSEAAGDSGGEAHAMQCDVADGAACVKTVEEVVEKLGRLDILVNNAGIIRDKLLMAMEPEDWGAVIDTNLTSVYSFCHAAMRPMMSQRFGRIINMSSVSAEFGNAGQVNYAASKGGIQGLTRCLATEIGKRNITVNAVAPGFIATDMTETVREMAGDVIKKKIPLKRMGTPEDIAAATLFLASDEAGYITGQVLTVDGGLTLGGL